MAFSKSLKNKLWFLLSGAEVAQTGRALDSTTNIVEGEAEDRVVAGSSPALGTIILLLNKIEYSISQFFEQNREAIMGDCLLRLLRGHLFLLVKNVRYMN